MEKIHMDYKWQTSKIYAFSDTEPTAGFQCQAILEYTKIKIKTVW